MNKSLRYVLISASIAAATQAAPFMAIGDGAELFATGVLGVRADDNVLLGADVPGSEKDGDIIFDIAPGLELVFGKNAQMQGALTLSHTFSNYIDHGELDTNLFNGDFVSKYDDGKMKLGFNASFHELAQNTVDVRPQNGRLVRRDIFNAGVNSEVTVTEITAVGVGLNYNSEDYKRNNFVDSDTLTVPVNFYYKWTPKVDLSLGYQYRSYEADGAGAFDSTDHFFSVGARGEFSPKLTGRVAVGYTERRFDRAESRDLIGVDASLAYEVSPKTTWQFGVTHDFGTSPTGQQQKNLVINNLLTNKLSEEWSLTGGLSYRAIRYDFNQSASNRTDDYWEGTLGASYIVNANARLSFVYLYRTYQSDLRLSEFDNNVFSIVANLRY